MGWKTARGISRASRSWCLEPGASDVRVMSVGSPSDPLASMLERVRRTFCVRAATLRLVDDEGRPAAFHAGAPIHLSDNTVTSRLQALASSDTVVVPDLDAEEGTTASESGRPRVRFYAGIPLLCATGRSVGVLSLFHSRPRRLSAEHVRFLEEFAAELAPVAAGRRDAVAIASLRYRLAAQSDLVRAQAQELAQGRVTFERASAEARIGIWECALHDDSLTWTEQVYDLFEIPRGARLVRRKTLECYSERSLILLERTRKAAIEEKRGFHLDAEITTMKGRRRWIRLSATIDCRDGIAVRLFGMKQDITEEKLLLARTRYLAEFDVMTGLANRARFQARLSDLDTGMPDREPVAALLLLDLDGFKQINDGFGHAFGDECLKETARRLGAVCGAADLVARIGGDEFAVVLGPGRDEAAVERLAAAIVASLGRPVERAGRMLRLGASVGIAYVDGPCAPADLFMRADTALYAAKAAGRGTFRTYVPVMAEADPGRMPGDAWSDRERRSVRRAPPA